MNLTFKYVGQGDSILLEWTTDSFNKIGLIDCNLISKDNNPALSYIKSKDSSKLIIEFIVLSHPHEDHFSGLFELLSYLNEENISINYFLHTCASQKNYLQGVDSIFYKDLLTKIFRLAAKMHETGKIKNYGFVNDLTSDISLLENVKMKILYPTSKYYSLYNSKAHKNDTLLKNNPNANYLSTVIKIYTKEWFIILTADCVKDIFDNIIENKSNLCGKLLLTQVSHHGSKHNFEPSFWRIFKSEFNSENSIISFGKNEYGHPDKKVLEYLNKLDYNIYLTSSDIERTSISSDLDYFSTSVISHRTNSNFDITCLISEDNIDIKYKAI